MKLHLRKETEALGMMDTHYFFLKKNHISFPQTETFQLETIYFCSGAFSLVQRKGPIEPKAGALLA